jgi:hypothetical protein
MGQNRRFLNPFTLRLSPLRRGNTHWSSLVRGHFPGVRAMRTAPRIRGAILPRASFISYLSPLNRAKRERTTFFTDSTANGRIL